MKKKRHSDMVAYYLWGKCLFIFMLSISLGIIDTQSEIIIIDAGGDRIIPPPDGPGDPPDDGLCYVLNDDGDWVEKNPGNPPDDEQNYVLDDNCDWVVEDPEDDAPDDPGVGAPGDPGAGGPGGGGGNPYMSTMSTMSTKNDDDPCPDPCEKWNSYHEDCFPIEPGDPPGDGPCWEWDDDCKWVPIDPGDPPDDGLCYVLDDECEWEEVDPGDPPNDGLCYVLNDECEWEEKDPGERPDGPCWELDDECNWILVDQDECCGDIEDEIATVEEMIEITIRSIAQIEEWLSQKEELEEQIAELEREIQSIIDRIAELHREYALKYTALRLAEEAQDTLEDACVIFGGHYCDDAIANQERIESLGEELDAIEREIRYENVEVVLAQLHLRELTAELGDIEAALARLPYSLEELNALLQRLQNRLAALREDLEECLASYE